MIKYLVTFKYDHSYNSDSRIFECKPGATWRELQKTFDPHYRYNNLRFFAITEEIPFTE